MNNDLISRKALMEKAKDYFISPDGALRLIESQPTAYDVDKIVEKIEDAMSPTVGYRYKFCETAEAERCANYESCEYCIVEKIIEIVKSGGVAENRLKETILAKYGNYTVLKRATQCQPFVVAYNMHDDGTWDFGNYYDDLFSACNYAKSKGEEGFISWNRMSEIATAAIKMLSESNLGSTREICEDSLCLDPEEIEYFWANISSVEIRAEELEGKK